MRFEEPVRRCGRGAARTTHVEDRATRAPHAAPFAAGLLESSQTLDYPSGRRRLLTCGSTQRSRRHSRVQASLEQRLPAIVESWLHLCESYVAAPCGSEHLPRPRTASPRGESLSIFPRRRPSCSSCSRSTCRPVRARSASCATRDRRSHSATDIQRRRLYRGYRHLLG